MPVSGKMDLREAEMFFGFSTLLSKDLKHRREQMKIASLIVGIVLMVLSGIGILICLVLVSTTNGRVSLEESLMVAIPLAFLFFIALVLTTVSAIFVFKARKAAAQIPVQAIKN